MTAIVEPDTTIIAHLDFQASVPCDVGMCHQQPVRAKAAVVVAVVAIGCCTIRPPVCPVHQRYLEALRARHQGIACGLHNRARCAHDAITFEPLP